MRLKAGLGAWVESLQVTNEGGGNAGLGARWLEEQETVGKCFVGIQFVFEDGKQLESRYGLSHSLRTKFLSLFCRSRSPTPSDRSN